MRHRAKTISPWRTTWVLGSAFMLMMAIPVWADSSSYKHVQSHGGYGHQGKSHSEYGSGHHSMGTFGSGHHGKGYGGHSSGHGSYGHGKGHHGRGHHQSATEFVDHILRFKEGMGITDDQESRLRGIQTDYKKTRIKMKAEVELANLDLHELLKNEQASLPNIESKLKEVHTLKADLYMASIKARREAKGVLTDEQRKRMKTVHDRIKAYGSKMMKSGHPGSYAQHGKEKDKDDD